jgi:RNA polymerase sigma-70 factor (ECF subfamily)
MIARRIVLNGEKLRMHKTNFAKSKVEESSNLHAIADQSILVLLNDQQRREEGFRNLVRTYRERLYGVIFRLSGSHEDTDDLLQEVFLKVYQHIGRFKGESGLYTWLYRIAVNESLSFLRKRNKMRTEALGTEMHGQSLDSPDGNDIQKQLEKAIVALPPKQRLVFDLRYFEEMSYREMSEVLETSEGSLKASFHHAVTKIEVYLKQA